MYKKKDYLFYGSKLKQIRKSKKLSITEFARLGIVK